MTLLKLFAQFVLVQGEQERLQRLRTHLRQRDQQVTRALARFGIVERDLLRQMRTVATDAEISALQEAHNDDWVNDKDVVFAYVPRANAEDAALFDEMDRKKIEGKKRQQERQKRATSIPDPFPERAK